ncbi:Kin of IRRE-like protein 3 [Nymphon striatum]|nr:Kin of IRRE-like protein 3 [Nymphon striatum]
MISDLAFLEINDVKQDDGGVYTCRVDFQRSRTILYQVELFVIVPPPKPTIIDKTTGKITDGIIDHYNEGDTVRLRCQVPRGNPTPKVFWLRKGYIFDKQFKVAPNGTVYNDLTLENISRELYHQQIVCLASNNNITLPSTTVIKAVFNLYPLKTLITTLQRPLTADRKIRMTCKTSGSKPPAVIRWFKENEQLKKVEQREDNGTTVSVLTFTPTASDNGDRLRCVAINPTMPGRKVEDSRQLNIFYFPIVDIRLGKEFGQESVNEGKSVYIECIVDSNPKPIHFDWFYNTIRLETNKSSGIVVANRTLILQRLKAYHRGNYSCAAVNQIGQGESRTIFLNVKHAPLCSRNLLKTYYASLMDNIRISCSVLANPPLVHFSWWFKSNLSSDQIPLKYKQNGTTSITYHQALSESDFGSLYCWAKNAIGDQHDPCVFEIVYASKDIVIFSLTLFFKWPNLLPSLAQLNRIHDSPCDPTLGSKVNQSHEQAFFVDDFVNISTQRRFVSFSDGDMRKLVDAISIQIELVKKEGFDERFVLHLAILAMKNSKFVRAPRTKQTRRVSFVGRGTKLEQRTDGRDFKASLQKGNDIQHKKYTGRTESNFSRDLLAGVPESVSNCTVNRDISSLYVKCVEGNDGDLKQSFMMEVTREDDNELIANVSALIKPQFTINLNSIDNNVIINVYAFNYKGRSASCTLSVRALVGNKRLFGEKELLYGTLSLLSFEFHATGYYFHPFYQTIPSARVDLIVDYSKINQLFYYVSFSQLRSWLIWFKPKLCYLVDDILNVKKKFVWLSFRDKERKYGAWHMIDTCNWFYTCRNSSLVTRKSDNRWNDMCGSHTCSDSGYHIHHNDEEKTSPARKKFGHSQSTEAGSGVETQTTASIYTDDCSESDKISPDIIPPSQQRVDDGLYIV